MASNNSAFEAGVHVMALGEASGVLCRVIKGAGTLLGGVTGGDSSSMFIIGTGIKSGELME